MDNPQVAFSALPPLSQDKGIERLGKISGILDEKLADGRQFLVGDRISIADISAASLLAPIILPPQQPVYSSQHFAGRLQQKNQQFEQYKSYEWLKGIYQAHRGDSYFEMKDTPINLTSGKR
ncbi:MAG: glutathione binding-like protein [Pseudomonadales bacterium]